MCVFEWRKLCGKYNFGNGDKDNDDDDDDNVSGVVVEYMYGTTRSMWVCRRRDVTHGLLCGLSQQCFSLAVFNNAT